MLYCFDSCCGWEMLMRSWNGLRPVYEFVVLSWRPSGGRGARCSAQFGCGFQPHNWRLRRGAITGTCRRHEIHQHPGVRGPQRRTRWVFGVKETRYTSETETGAPAKLRSHFVGWKKRIHQQCDLRFTISTQAILRGSRASPRAINCRDSGTNRQYTLTVTI